MKYVTLLPDALTRRQCSLVPVPVEAASLGVGAADDDELLRLLLEPGGLLVGSRGRRRVREGRRGGARGLSPAGPEGLGLGNSPRAAPGGRVVVDEAGEVGDVEGGRVNAQHDDGGLVVAVGEGGYLGEEAARPRVFGVGDAPAVHVDGGLGTGDEGEGAELGGGGAAVGGAQEGRDAALPQGRGRQQAVAGEAGEADEGVVVGGGDVGRGEGDVVAAEGLEGVGVALLPNCRRAGSTVSRRVPRVEGKGRRGGGYPC